MNLLDIYEQREPYQQAIDRLEQHRIDTLNDRMQELLGRARTASPEMKAALKREFEKIKSERDGYYKIRETQKGQDVVDRTTKMKALTPSKPGAMGAIKDVASGLKNFLQGKPETGPTYEAQKKNSEQDLEEHGGGIGPSQRWQDLMPEEKQKGVDGKACWDGYKRMGTKKKGGKTVDNCVKVGEGWSNKMVARRTGTAPTPYSVYIKGKEWKSFADDDYAENVANKLRARFKQEGRDPSVITIAPSGLEEGIKKGAAATALAACIAAGGTLSGCATNPSVGGAIGTVRDVGTAAKTASTMTRAGVQDELSQELRNFIRAQGGDPGAQNLSTLYKLQKRLQGKRDQPQTVNEIKDTEAVEQAIIKRIMVAHRDMLIKYGPEKIMNAAEDVAYNVGDIGEIGSSDVSGWVRQVEQILGAVQEAKDKPSLRDPADNPCWKGYHPVGTKKKNGKTVPNCVPNAKE